MISPMTAGPTRGTLLTVPPVSLSMRTKWMSPILFSYRPRVRLVGAHPKLWEATGLPYPRLLDRLIELALERHDRSSKLETRAPTSLESGES